MDQAALACWTKRCLRSGSATLSCGRTLLATTRSRWVSRALYTMPHPAFAQLRFDLVAVEGLAEHQDGCLPPCILGRIRPGGRPSSA